jgi:hypothetical protein
MGHTLARIAILHGFDETYCMYSSPASVTHVWAALADFAFVKNCILSSVDV